VWEVSFVAELTVGFSRRTLFNGISQLDENTFTESHYISELKNFVKDSFCSGIAVCSL
jgi:hypothetical protein